MSYLLLAAAMVPLYRHYNKRTHRDVLNDRPNHQNLPGSDGTPYPGIDIDGIGIKPFNERRGDQFYHVVNGDIERQRQGATTSLKSFTRPVYEYKRKLIPTQ